MGYKLAGYDVLGCVEIDPQMMKVYRQNHNPKYHYLMGIQQFNKIPDDDLPQEFFELDILDGSPPCSSFSMAGSREKAWGKNKKFREGQSQQVLDDLFFHFIDTVKKLQPKVVIAENVKGLIQGKAKGYVKQIFKGFKDAGYDCQLFLLNAARMGVPQRRERTFFIANRIGERCSMRFDEKSIPLSDALSDFLFDKGSPLPPIKAAYWEKTRKGDSFSKIHPKGHYFNEIKCSPNLPANTLPAAGGLSMWNHPYYLSKKQVSIIQSFPDDYNYCGIKNTYMCGMSVPPFMMQRVATEVYKQMLFGK